MATLATPQLHFEIDEPHVARPAVGKAGMLDHGPVSAVPAGRFDHVPGPQILKPESIARRQSGHRRF
jgi:hypothetical protein